MKKILACILAAVMLSTGFAGVFAIAADDAFLLGDVDGDGRVTAADARLTMRCAVGLETFTDDQILAADISSGGAVDVADARYILRYSVGLVDDAWNIPRSYQDPALRDTDKDGLTDKDEKGVYLTDPNKYDTDGDGVSDGKEVKLSTDPLTPQSTFHIVATVTDADPAFGASVDITLPGPQADTLEVTKKVDELLFPEDMPGAISKPYSFHVDGEIESATITIEFDESKLTEDSDPVIYSFDETNQSLTPLATTVVGHIASTEVTELTTYILIDRVIYDAHFIWVDIWETEKQYDAAHVVFVIDDSGSMTYYDGSNQRLTVARDLINKLPTNSKVGIVKFSDYTTILTPELTDDRDTALGYLTTSTFSSYGGTCMYRAINDAFPMLDSTPEGTLKVMIVLSDGVTEDTNMAASTIALAQEKEIKVYTVGLGSDSDVQEYFNNYLKPLADQTGAKFYLAADASELELIYNDIGQKIDITTDSDGDGISDYYEDNMVAFNGKTYKLNKNNPDTDGDGVKDGDEIVLQYTYNEDNTQVKVHGRLISDPTNPNSRP